MAVTQKPDCFHLGTYHFGEEPYGLRIGYRGNPVAVARGPNSFRMAMLWPSYKIFIAFT